MEVLKDLKERKPLHGKLEMGANEPEKGRRSIWEVNGRKRHRKTVRIVWSNVGSEPGHRSGHAVRLDPAVG